jgi:hypothetical protein
MILQQHDLQILRRKQIRNQLIFVLQREVKSEIVYNHETWNCESSLDILRNNPIKNSPRLNYLISTVLSINSEINNIKCICS